MSQPLRHQLHSRIELAAQLRQQQPDVMATDVPTATYLRLTVRPRSLTAWRRWLAMELDWLLQRYPAVADLAREAGDLET
ncbi:hypothetical protein GTY54_19905 [Streptomyces sp. SID625]|nr:hypothetical protein [Streptomyces sp. SID625]